MGPEVHAISLGCFQVSIEYSLYCHLHQIDIFSVAIAGQINGKICRSGANDRIMHNPILLIKFSEEISCRDPVPFMVPLERVGEVQSELISHDFSPRVKTHEVQKTKDFDFGAYVTSRRGWHVR